MACLSEYKRPAKAFSVHMPKKGDQIRRLVAGSGATCDVTLSYKAISSVVDSPRWSSFTLGNEEEWAALK